MAKDNSKPQPPYVSYGVFERATEQLAESTVPTGPLDRRVLDGISGADHGALMSGLSFLGLVDDDRKATGEYRDLVHAFKDKPKFKEVFYRIITLKYGPIIGTLDLKNGTIAQLEKAFKDFGVAQGQMLTKTIRFFVKALTECGFQVSPHITKPKPKGPRTTTNGRASKTGADKQRGRATANQPTYSGTMEEHTPAGTGRLPIPGMANAFIQYPLDVTEPQVDLFQAMIGVLRTYVQGRTGAKEKKQ